MNPTAPSPSLGGGVLSKDVRCDAAAPRTEVVTFRDARPGRYRVGVEYAQSCALRRRNAPYRLEVLAGEASWHAESEIAPGSFDNVALEFVLGEVTDP